MAWSESFGADERAGRRLGAAGPVLAVAAVVLGGAGVAGDVVLSVDMTSQELTSRAGSWVLGFVAVALGLLGPYASILAWRARANASRPLLRRVLTTGIVAAVAGGVAVGWLLLIRSSLHPKPLII